MTRKERGTLGSGTTCFARLIAGIFGAGRRRFGQRKVTTGEVPGRKAAVGPRPPPEPATPLIAGNGRSPHSLNVGLETILEEPAPRGRLHALVGDRVIALAGIEIPSLSIFLARRQEVIGRSAGAGRGSFTEGRTTQCPRRSPLKKPRPT